jgi:Fur family ferric uptake transcriptional regulator
MTSPDLRSELRSRGYRVTPQRRLVLEAVGALGHATPDEVHARVAGSGMNLSTVYRTLELLEQLGMVTHTHLGHGAATYHAATEAAHVHLVCRSCGAVAETSPALVADAIESIAEAHGFAVDVHHMAIFGLCSSCLTE